MKAMILAAGKSTRRGPLPIPFQRRDPIAAHQRFQIWLGYFQKGDKDMNRISLTIVSSFDNIRLVGLCAREIACRSFGDEALAEIELTAVEAVNNCVEHACAGSDKHQITIEFLLSEDRLSIEIVDQGKKIEPEWLDNLNANFDFDDTDLENLPEGGMGLKIVKSCMDEVSYQYIDERNRWLLIKFTGKAAI